jgi:hypothetical protein
MKATALRYGVRMDRHGRDGRPLRAATGRMADGRDRQLHHAFRVVHTYLPGGIVASFLCVVPWPAEIPIMAEVSTSPRPSDANP